MWEDRELGERRRREEEREEEVEKGEEQTKEKSTATRVLARVVEGKSAGELKE